MSGCVAAQGTLTTDKLVPVGIVNGDAKPPAETGGGGAVLAEVAVAAACSEAAVTIAGCHSLIAVDEAAADLLGDPIETAALSGVGWSYSHAAQTATPGTIGACEAKIAELNRQLAPPAAANPNQTLLNGQPAPAPPPLADGTAAKLREELANAETALAAAKE